LQIYSIFTGIYNQRTISFSSGKIDSINNSNKSKVFLKVGAESGFTVARFEGHCHSEIDDLSDGGSNSFSLYNQYEIKPLSKETPFLKRGDSGSLIFVLNNTSPVELTCVGLAVAATRLVHNDANSQCS
jgi:hypothetical protein